jgi:hypothetical protein
MIPDLVTWSLVWIALALGLVTVTRSIAPVAERVALGRELRRHVSGASRRRVVVVIDNLDRLQGKEALETLSEIRTFVEVPDGRCVFIIPIDWDAFIEHCRRLGMGEAVARDYLEKFFNLNVLLTKPAQTDLREWTRLLLVECMGDGDDRRYLAEIIADAADGSPRAARRIVRGVVARRLLLDRLPDRSACRRSLWSRA